MDSSIPIAEWLANLDLAQYAEAFAENKIGFDMLADLTNDDLRELGVNALRDRKLLLSAIAKMRAQQDEPELAAPALPLGLEPQSASPSITDSVYQQSSIPIFPSAPLAPLVLQSLPEPVPAAAPGRGAVSPAIRGEVPVTSEASMPAAARRPQPALPIVDHPPSQRPFWTRLMASKFLLVSITVHILFALGATYFIVQRVQAKRRVTFQGGPPAVNASKRALEHKVSLAKKKNSGGAPPQAKRVVSAGIAKISLPDLPSVPTVTSVPGMKASMGGAGFGTGMGFGPGSGSSMGGGGGGGAGGLTLFGFRGAGQGLIGTFYDLKQTREHKPTDMAGSPNEAVNGDSPPNMRYKQIVGRFVNSWNPSVLEHYFRAPGQMSITQIFIPTIDADAAPKAFGVDKECQPRRWIVHYTGEIVALRSGKFRFIGYGDDMLIIRCKGHNVLDGSIDKVAAHANENPRIASSGKFALAAGHWIDAQKDEAMKIDILIGECPGGEFNNFLFVEQEGVQHPPGTYPVFQLRTGDVPEGDAPAHSGTVLFGSKQTGFGSLLDSMQR